MPASPGAWVIVRDSPSRCEATNLTPQQRYDCYKDSGTVFIVVLVAFVLFVAIMLIPRRPRR